MAFQINSAVGGRLGGRPGVRHGKRARLMSEINVTPFVDVMLVLLVIFMVTAPLMTTGVQVDLPDSAAPPIDKEEEPLIITLSKKGEIYIQDTKVNRAQLSAKLKAIAKSKGDSRIFVRGDKALDYGKVMEAVEIITAAGYRKIALITDSSPPEQK